MKHIVTIFVAALLLTACHNPGKPGKVNEAANPLANGSGDSGDSTGGSRLVATNDCSGCHSMTAKSTGPSFQAISNRYPNSLGTAQNLAYSILYGVKGLWTSASAMPAHSNVSYQDALKMAQYILSVKSRLKEDSIKAGR